MLAAVSGLERGKCLHHLFADKDAFVGQVLQSHHGARLVCWISSRSKGLYAAAQLRYAVWLLATCFRAIWPGARAHADSADGVEVVEMPFMRRKFRANV